jgi:hypothetical protein
MQQRIIILNEAHTFVYNFLNCSRAKFRRNNLQNPSPTSTPLPGTDTVVCAGVGGGEGFSKRQGVQGGTGKIN